MEKLFKKIEENAWVNVYVSVNSALGVILISSKVV